ncbi:4Fe-4S dicluster domain-containing protein [Slackia heliotrinireducens]|uniref:Fe-S-cluster-containing hydrogenase subunit n=1 Tax=Slackia heliotrinireducens (strain ATCC 29202 / DSM 20476 / NCTC 11029 / RHS 1) TaxID=471855 RepID=C7N863_SLAHD|nr:4Fe-4S dicluster domain-containing protein [Slackia heliotrinireducens]ACV23098.1 Fe-S-cluster-containing hydrogenase subunit [Slackia heliotrinireducens DSM 20476]
MTRNAMVVDLNRCIGCYGCEVACKQEHDVALGEYWCKVYTDGPQGTHPHITQYWLPTLCQQCENAPCIEVCPTGASQRDPVTGVVIIDRETCIGCKSCLTACPYGVRSYNASTNTVGKCTLCNDRLRNDKLPACVLACSGQARFFGDLDDPESAASKALAAHDEADIHQFADSGNAPLTRYILSEKYAEWISDDWYGLDMYTLE